MRQPFCILSVRGDVLEDGELHFVGAMQTLGAARRRIKALAKSSPGQYAIYNGQTGERMPIVTGETFEADLANTRAEQSKRPADRVVRIQLAAAARNDS
jgi:hypothetical protein